MLIKLIIRYVDYKVYLDKLIFVSRLNCTLVFQKALEYLNIINTTIKILINKDFKSFKYQHDASNYLIINIEVKYSITQII